MRRHGVRCLLMGGHACVFYGAAEFSRDVDFVILADSENLRRLQSAVDELEAIEKKLDEERLAEVVADKTYWAPLRQELERLRHLHPHQ